MLVDARSEGGEGIRGKYKGVRGEHEREEVSEGFAEVVQEGTGACVGGCEIGGSLVSGLGLEAAFTREL